MLPITPEIDLEKPTIWVNSGLRRHWRPLWRKKDGKKNDNTLNRQSSRSRIFRTSPPSASLTLSTLNFYTLYRIHLTSIIIEVTNRPSLVERYRWVPVIPLMMIA